MRFALLLLLPLLGMLAGCAATIPERISEAPDLDLPLAQVRANIDAYVGRPVRWGGTVASVENRADETWLDLVGRELEGSGRPRINGESEGRFIAKVKGFLDPAVYAKGRQVTVAGTVTGQVVRRIGEYPYAYAVVAADTVKLWEREVQPPYYYREPFYDPFYDPFWPARMYPWYAPYPFHPYYPFRPHWH